MFNLRKTFSNINVFHSKAILDSVKSLHLSAISRVKEIHVLEEGDKITVEGKYVTSPRDGLVVKTGLEESSVCPLCALSLNLKHTDVLILSQFLRKDGCLLPRRITGLCNRQQKIVEKLVAMSQKAGLMPNLNRFNQPGNPNKLLFERRLHRYFEEDTIKLYAKKYKDEKNPFVKYEMRLRTIPKPPEIK